MSSTDRIEKKIELKAPVARVWRAISDAREFGTWFQAELDGAFAPGAVIPAVITTKGYEGAKFEIHVERMEPERLLAFRWHPGEPDPSYDYTQEPMTLVEFHLEPTAAGTLLVITESGFDRLAPERRAKAFAGNSQGWDFQLENIARHVA